MFSKLTIFVLILFQFDLVLLTSNPIVEPKKLYRKYRNVLRQGLNMEYLGICDFDVPLWFRLCKIAIPFLRNYIPKYHHLFYVNRNSFENRFLDGAICETRTVKLLAEIFPDQESTVQIAVPCYYTPSVIQSNTALEDYIFHNKIVIYPGSKGEMMLFEKNDNANDYTLVAWVTTKRWYTLPPGEADNVMIVPNVLKGPNTGLAEYILDLRDHHLHELLSMNKNENHVLFKIHLTMRVHTCNVMFARLEYEHHFQPHKSTYKTLETEVRPKMEKVKIVLPIEEISTNYLWKFIELTAFRCRGRKKNAENRYEDTDEYKITTGLKINELILLRTKVVINNIEYNEPIEIIENVNHNFINDTYGAVN